MHARIADLVCDVRPKEDVIHVSEPSVGYQRKSGKRVSRTVLEKSKVTFFE